MGTNHERNLYLISQNADEIEGKCRLVIVREGGNTEVVSHNAKMTFSDLLGTIYQHPTNNWSLMVPE